MTEDLVVRPDTGEVFDFSSAGVESLASVVVDLQQRRTELNDFEEILHRAIVERLDRDACWTQRVGDFEIKAPSPTAGTESYPPDVLRGELNSLVEQDVISREAAQGALKRQLLLTVAVPWGADLQALVGQLKGAVGIQIAGVEMDAISADASERSVASGINKLRKIPGAVEALDRAKVEQPVGRRRASVKLKTRETV